MDTDKLFATLAKLARKPVEDIRPHLSLATLGLTSSFGLGALRSNLEKQTTSRLPALTLNTTVGDLTHIVGGIAGEPATRRSPLAPPAAGDVGTRSGWAVGPRLLGMGIDMQEIASFPRDRDLRASAFYAGHFSPSEIATAILKPDPVAHLCGTFCAKEATKKSHTSLVNLRMSDILVSHCAMGKPEVRILLPGFPFDHLLSITHTETTAAATCLTLQAS